MHTYHYRDLSAVNRWLAVLLLPPALLSVAGLLHGSGILAQMNAFPPALAGDALPADYREALRRDGWLRLSQISLTVGVLTFFFTAWLYLAFRNLLALLGPVEHSIRRSLQLFASLMIGVFFALRMFRRLWRDSQPPADAWQALRDEPWHAESWLVPLWWADLIAANVCKVLAVYHFAQAQTVAEMIAGYHLMLAAYALYLPLYLLTWRLAHRVDWFQRQAAGIVAQKEARLAPG